MAAETQRPVALAGTLAGLGAVVIWSANIACSRSLIEKLGTFTSAFAIYSGAGAVTLAAAALRPGGLRAFGRLSRRYWAVCGGLFLLYVLTFNTALGFASDRAATIVVGIINYLWPSLTLIFSVPIVGERARWTLWPGVAAAILGTALAAGGGETPGGGGFAAHLATDWFPFLCALVGAVTWALYSNFSRKLAPADAGGLPFFMIVSGLVVGSIRLLRDESSSLAGAAWAELAYMVLIGSALAYALWDRGVRSGSLVVLAIASCFIPVCSTILSGLYLGVPLVASSWAGCVLVSVGALVCRSAFRAPATPGHATRREGREEDADRPRHDPAR